MKEAAALFFITMNAEFDVTGITIETKRLILRPWKITDLKDFYAYASVPDVGERAGWKHHESVEKSNEILKLFIEEKKTFAVISKKNNRAIGSLGIELYGNEDKLTEFANLKGREIGYVLSKDYWGQGLMPEAVKAVTDYLFNTLDYDFVLCGHFDKNTQSARVQDKCGFKPYRKLVFDTRMGTKESGILRLLLNPNKDIKLVFSHPETLISAI